MLRFDQSNQIYLGISTLSSVVLACLPDIKPLVCFFVKHVVFIAKLLRGNTLFQGLCFCSRSIFIRTADIQCAAISCSYTIDESRAIEVRDNIRLYLLKESIFK